MLSSNIDKLVVQYYFQLVRNNTETEQILYSLLMRIHKDHIKNIKPFLLLYKLIGQTRDIVCGKGECDLSYMQIYIWWQFYPILSYFAFQTFIWEYASHHPYGSWKDIKKFCHFIKNKTGDENHPLIIFASNLLLQQLIWDNNEYSHGRKISLAAKWAPREKKKHGWLFNKLALTYSHLSTDITIGIEKKARMTFRKLLSKLNRSLDTVQIKMCNRKWDKIDFSTITSRTLYKNLKTFQSKKEFQEYYTNLRFLPAKRCHTYELVKLALNATTDEECAIVNKQWAEHRLMNYDLANMIAIIDTSLFSSENGKISLYNGIGIGIRISEKSRMPFKDGLFIYSNYGEWIKFNPSHTFVEKVKIVSSRSCAINQNFPKVFEEILNIFIKKQISQDDIKYISFVILSGIQLSFQSLPIHTYLRYLFLKGPYTIMPHIIYWNLSDKPYFPVDCYKKNTTMISGFNTSTLNFFGRRKSRSSLQIHNNSVSFLDKILSGERYKILALKLIDFINKNNINI